MSSPSPKEIIDLARECDFVERRAEASSTLFFKRRNDDGTIINVFYTTRGVMTKLKHPVRGDNELWRSDAYDSLESLEAIFRNPRAHTGKGYRNKGQSVRGCTRCGLQKKRSDFSKNQWQKGPDTNACKECIEQRQRGSGSSEMDRSCIECDAEGCANVAPAIRCSRCLMAYYCSEACLNRHRRAHAVDCFPIDDMRARFATYKEPDTFMMKGMAMAKRLSGASDMESQLLQAEYIYQDDGQWESAAEVYKRLLMNEDVYMASSPPQQRRVWMGLTRCFYEMGQYDKAIHAGTAAIEMNRHFPQVHRYVALSQKASGDLDAAKASMTRAVLYECPWDDSNLKANMELLKETFP